MSELLGILDVNGKTIHVVDWDRPTWFDPTDPDGLRVIPDPDHFVADALAVLHLDGLKTCGKPCGRSTAGLNMLAGPQCEHVDAIRARIYAEFDEPLVFMHPDDRADALVVRDLARFQKAKTALTKLDGSPSTSGEVALPFERRLGARAQSAAPAPATGTDSGFVRQVIQVLHDTITEEEEFGQWFEDTLYEYDEPLRKRLVASMALVEPELSTDLGNTGSGLWIADGMSESLKYEGSPASFAWLPVRLGDTLQLLVPSLVASGDDGITGYATGLLNAVPTYLIDYTDIQPGDGTVMPVSDLKPASADRQWKRPLRLGWMPPRNLNTDEVQISKFSEDRKVPTEFAAYPKADVILAIFLSSFTRGVAVACLRLGVEQLRANLPQLAATLKAEWHWYMQQIQHLKD